MSAVCCVSGLYYIRLYYNSIILYAYDKNKKFTGSTNTETFDKVFIQAKCLSFVRHFYGHLLYMFYNCLSEFTDTPYIYIYIYTHIHIRYTQNV